MEVRECIRLLLEDMEKDVEVRECTKLLLDDMEKDVLKDDTSHDVRESTLALVEKGRKRGITILQDIQILPPRKKPYIIVDTITIDSDSDNIYTIDSDGD